MRDQVSTGSHGPPRAVIVGAGIAGLALANRLDTHGWRVTVVEQASGPRTQGYMMDFFGPGYDAAEAMGLLPRLRELARHFDAAALVDETGKSQVSVDYDRFAESLSGSLISLMRPDLECALREALPERVELRFGTGPERVTEHGDGVSLRLSDGTALEADLLAGADGIHSTVRHLVFGPEHRYLRYLGFHTGAFTFRDNRVHAQTLGRFLMTDSIDAQVGLYALEGDRVAAFTVHRTEDPALPADTRAAMRRAYTGLGWAVPRALEMCPPPQEIYYDQVAQIETDRWSRGRTVLLGDSCHAVSLLAGQGASMAVGGAFVLAEELARAGSVEQGLHSYEARWRPVVQGRQRAARTGPGWFLPSSRARLRMRRQFLRLVSLPVVDRLIASALSGKPSRVVKDAAAESDAVPPGARPADTSPKRWQALP